MPLSQAPTDLKERAKQGDEKAIAAVLNHFFQPQGITAKATLKEGNLLLLLESAMVPDRDTLVPFIHQGLANLGINNINPKVKIGGRKTGIRKAAWQQEIDLEDPPEPIVPDGENDLPLEDDDMPIEDEDFLDEPLTEDAEEEEFIEEDSSLEAESDSSEKSSKNKLILVGSIVLLLLLGGGAAAYFLFPNVFAGLLGGQNTTTESQPMSTNPSNPSTEQSEPPKASENNTTQPPDAENSNSQPSETEEPLSAEAPPPAETPSPEEAAANSTSNEANETSNSASSSVSFYDAVNRANKAWEMTQVAGSSQEWQEIAILWNDALVLMKQVPESHPSYDIAQDRIPKYRKYREFAKQMADMTSQ